MSKVHLIYSPSYFSYPNGSNEPLEEPNELYEQAKVGDVVVFSSSAPGYGCVHYRVTKKTAEGVFGMIIKDTRGIFTEADVC